MFNQVKEVLIINDSKAQQAKLVNEINPSNTVYFIDKQAKARFISIAMKVLQEKYVE